MYRPVLVTPPALKPITLAEAKAWLDIPYTNKDAVITGLIAAATAHLDGWTGILGRCLCEQTWRQDFDRLNRCLRLPLAPVISITSVKYDDADGVEQTVSSGDYELLNDDLGPYVRFKDAYSFPQVHDERPAVRVTYLAGYPNTGSEPDVTSTVPDDIKHAIALLVRHWFDNPTAVVVGVTAQSVPHAVDALLAPHRRIRF
ncbi:head-tail connector protein [Pseudorhodoplanes sinuspersici]|nr:phage head-tail connector protein [Pseudorhodoplanes sinuspersici]RKE73654.1 putative phiE125 gp8 family phage protein [Pseudorhodoplanes sinuspersici]